MDIRFSVCTGRPNGRRNKKDGPDAGPNEDVTPHKTGPSSCLVHDLQRKQANAGKGGGKGVNGSRKEEGGEGKERNGVKGKRGTK